MRAIRESDTLYVLLLLVVVAVVESAVLLVLGLTEA